VVQSNVKCDRTGFAVDGVLRTTTTVYSTVRIAFRLCHLPLACTVVLATVVRRTPTIQSKCSEFGVNEDVYKHQCIVICHREYQVQVL
jgi:hypothetical protein